MHKDDKSRSGRTRVSSEIANGLRIGDVMLAFHLLLRLLMT